MDEAHYKLFFDSVVEAVASKVLESSIVANEVARIVSSNPKAINSILANVDPDKVADSMGRAIQSLNRTHRFQNSPDLHDATSSYSVIMKKAADRASEIVADQMQKEIMGA